ncbi:MAG: hypothetical protein H6672_13675 [Anaerolineaceae bacterium]|nr:hypothetical protein [Anaerolineaceae bacterium]
MKKLRWSMLLLSIIMILVSVVLLLNFTAPNPTGRRYSSQTPLTSGQANAGAIGLDAERILAVDLGLPRNDQSDQHQCFCSSGAVDPPLSECRVCMSYAPLSTSAYRRPDFVGSNFIVESKNAQNLLYTYRSFEQITDYAISARELGWPLWVYTRVNTTIDPGYYDLVASTGGAIVPYFTVPGYADPVDAAATKGLLLGGLLLVVSGGWSLLAGRSRVVRPKPERQPNDPLSNLEEHVRRSKDRARREIDTEDSRP